MAEESVIFEIQVEKKILEQVFTENKHLKDSYDKLIKNEDTIKTMKKLEEETGKLRRINEELTEENVKLKAELDEMAHNRRIREEKDKTNELEQSLEMKLQKARLSEEFEEEKKILDELLRDQSKLQTTENELKTASENLEKVSEELTKTRRLLSKYETENRDLDEEKLKLELQLGDLTKKLRLHEERNISNDLEHVESKLLKLKLQSVENEKQYLLDEFERERKIITKQNKPRVAKLEENLKLLRKWIEKEAKERRPRDSEEVKILKEKIHTLENEKLDLIEGFELERRVFQRVLRTSGQINID